MPNQTHKIGQLQPVIYNSSHGSNNVRYGLDLQLMAQYYPELVLTDSQGNPLIINYAALIPILIQQIQLLTQQVQELQDNNGQNENQQ